MTIKMRNNALQGIENVGETKGMNTPTAHAILFTNIIYALLYIGDVLKDGFKKLEKKGK